MTLEEIMLKCWQQVRERFLFPNLPDPVLADSAVLATAAIEMVSHQISVNRDFVEKFHQNGVSYETGFAGLLAHEVNHYLHCPYDLARSLWIDLLCQKAAGEFADAASAQYVDIVNNLDIIMRKRAMEVAELLRVQEAKYPLAKLVKAYYQRATGYDMKFDENAELDGFLKEQLKRMFTIDFFDIAQEDRNVRRFARIVRDVMQHYNLKDQKPKHGAFGAKSYDQNEIKRALKELAAKVGKDDFDRAVEQAGIRELLAAREGRADDGKGGLLYYQMLADNFPVQLKKRKLKENGSLFPYTHKEFEPEDSPQDIDIFASLGKPFLPGLGKVWVKKAGVHFAEEQKAPNVVIMLDRSGSMKDCEPYAKAACIATANAYLANSAAVAVYVFNDGIDEEELAKGYQTDRDSVHAALAREARGDTKISDEGLKKLDEIVAKSCSPVDIVLVTDLEIDGRERLFSYLHGLSGRNRVTIVYTGRNGGIEELKKKYDGAGYAIFAISSPEQIPGIVIGEVAEGLK